MRSVTNIKFYYSSHEAAHSQLSIINTQRKKRRVKREGSRIWCYRSHLPSYRCKARALLAVTMALSAKCQPPATTKFRGARHCHGLAGHCGLRVVRSRRPKSLWVMDGPLLALWWATESLTGIGKVPHLLQIWHWSGPQRDSSITHRWDVLEWTPVSLT